MPSCRADYKCAPISEIPSNDKDNAWTVSNLKSEDEATIESLIEVISIYKKTFLVSN